MSVLKSPTKPKKFGEHMAESHTELSPSTTNRSSGKNWLTTVCLCIIRLALSLACHSIPSSYPETASLHSEFFRSFYNPTLHTFKTCNSFKPFCISSWISLGSCTSLCSLNESLVLRFAYSLKLYAANCWPCRNNWRYCNRNALASNLVRQIFHFRS